METTLDELKLHEAFNEAAMLNQKYDPWVRKRVVAEYAECEIVSCEQDNWWYKPFIGVKFFGQLVFRDYGGRGRYLFEVAVVRLVNSKVHHGRTVTAKDIILL